MAQDPTFPTEPAPPGATPGEPAGAPAPGEWTASDPRWGPGYVQPPVPVTSRRRTMGTRAVAAVAGAALLLVVLVASVAAVSGGAGASGAPALAAPSMPLTAAASQAPSSSAAPHRAQTLCQDFMSNLASQLGVTTDKLQAALVAAANGTLDQAVSQGIITQDQASFLKGRLSNAGTTPCANIPQGIGKGKAGAAVKALDPSALLDAAAKALNTDRQTLLQELGSLQQGEDLRTIAQKHNVSYSTLTSAIHDAAKTSLDAAVKAGTITSAQETNILDALDRQLANGGAGILLRVGRFGDRDGLGPFGGMMRGWGGMMGRGGNGPAASPAATPGV